MSEHKHKRERAELLSSNPNIFTGNRSFGPLKINNIAQSMGLKDFGGSMKPTKPFKRSK